MRFLRTAAGLTAVAAVVLGLGLVTAGPAAAQAERGTWRPYGNTNPITSSSSTWKCATSEVVATNVVAQVCSIRSPDGVSVQSAAIVRNNRPAGWYTARSSLNMRIGDVSIGSWNCVDSGVAPTSWSVCFGTTEQWPTKISTIATVNNSFLGRSPTV